MRLKQIWNRKQEKYMDWEEYSNLIDNIELLGFYSRNI